MKILEVNDAETRRKFHNVCAEVYKNDSEYVRPLDVEIESTFTPSANPFYEHGEARRWIAVRNEKVVGRVAAFINKKKAFRFELPTGGMGFFESINDEPVAFALFRQCEKWLREQGMKAMEGPVNFGENNNYWGLLTKGFTQPAYGMAYNPPYYSCFFERFGFHPAYEQFTHHFDVHRPLPQRFRNIVERINSHGHSSFEHLDLQHFDKYVNDFVEIYNKAWSHHENFNAISPEYVRKTFEDMKVVMVPEMMWFAYVDHQPAGFMITVPDANQIIKYMHGKMNLLSKLKFLWYKSRNTIDRVRVIIMGVVPEHQKKGLESGMIVKAFDAVKAMGQYREAELSWVGSFNPGMIAIHKASGAVLAKTHITYRKTISDCEDKL